MSPACYADLILMDIVLDGKMTGIDASEYIYKNLDIPIVYTTAYGDKKTLESAKKTEPFGYIVKPITEASLLRPPIELAIYNHKIKQSLSKEAKKYHVYPLQESWFPLSRSLRISDSRYPESKQ